MIIGEVCKHNVATVLPGDDLTKAAELMRARHVGYLVVVEPDVVDGSFRPVGVVTDRDIVVEVVARAVDAKTLAVRDVMTEAPVTVTDGAPITAALREMRRLGVRRLPVVGVRGQLVGVIALDDIVDTIAAELQDVASSIRNERRMESALRP